jgi:hypothetical protein
LTQLTYDKYEDGLRVIKKDNSDYEYKIILNRQNGLWSVGTSSGSVPQKLSGTYTSAAEARKAVINYQNTPVLKKKA